MGSVNGYVLGTSSGRYWPVFIEETGVCCFWKKLEIVLSMMEGLEVIDSSGKESFVSGGKSQAGVVESAVNCW